MGLKGLQIEVEVNYRLVLSNNLTLILSKVTMTCLDTGKKNIFLLVHIKDMSICILSLQKNRRKKRYAVTTCSTQKCNEPAKLQFRNTRNK